MRKLFILIALTGLGSLALQSVEAPSAASKPRPIHIAVSAPKAALTAPVAAVLPAQPLQTPVYPVDSHEALMDEAGIPAADFGAADYIVSHESGWNADATEPNSGAHGLPQALPYSKTGCGWDDAVCQLQWANNYAAARYGGWWQAQAYWSAHHNW